SRPDGVVPDARITKQRGAVACVTEDSRFENREPRPGTGDSEFAAKLVDDCPNSVEAFALRVENGAFRDVSRREVRVDRVELQIRARKQARQGATQIVVTKPEAVHACVDLQVI